MTVLGKNAFDDPSLAIQRGDVTDWHGRLNVLGGVVNPGGTVTLNGTTPVTVTDASITANSVILFTLKTVGGTVGAAPVVATITPGTGFTVKGTALDTSVYNYAVLGNG